MEGEMDQRGGTGLPRLRGLSGLGEGDDAQPCRRRYDLPGRVDSIQAAPKARKVRHAGVLHRPVVQINYLQRLQGFPPMGKDWLGTASHRQFRATGNSQRDGSMAIRPLRAYTQHGGCSVLHGSKLHAGRHSRRVCR